MEMRIVAALCAGLFACVPAHGEDVDVPASIRPLLEAHCVACHEGSKPKGGLELAGPIAAGKIDESVLRALRKRLAKRDMPPADEPERPSLDEYRAAVSAIDALLPPLAREVAAVRRLNRVQYANAVRDVLGTEIDVRDLLPRDEIGEGFDTTADTLVLPMLVLERYFTAAEEIALALVPPAGPAAPITIAPERLERRGQGHARDGFAWLWTNGTLTGAFEVKRAGRYRVTLEAAAQQAGNDVARLALLIDGKVVGEHEVAATPDKPMAITWEGTLAAGERRVGARFLNDFYDPNAADQRRRDRNLAVGAIRIEGPLDAPTATPFITRAEAVAGEGTVSRRLGRVAAAFGEELFRRPLGDAERDALVRTAREASAPEKGTRARDIEAEWRDGLRVLVTALLVDPRFLLRVEKPGKNGEATRELDGYEVASRLSFFLWSSVPDAALRRAAAAGELGSPDGVAREARRMLKDPRAKSLSQRFATQWLGIDGLEYRSMDPKVYPGLDAALLSAMRRETERLFDSVVRGERPVRALVTARETEVDAALAGLYGMEPPAESAVAVRAIDDARAGGVLGHASVLVATSNPTRTSPVKRGKWVLEALLDEAPPPPPPGVPQLPETKDARHGLSVRELMAEHRNNPDCASCHVRMDAIGLAFERLDADGRFRSEFDGLPIDDSTEMPDGSVLRGARGVEAMLAASTSFERSLARHLLVYALGRGTADADDVLVDRLAADLAAKGDFVTLVEGIVTADAFRIRTNLRDSARPPLPSAGPAVD
jgi:mono/diheme cytochrome c family protein